jgi:hypothetical protein
MADLVSSISSCARPSQRARPKRIARARARRAGAAAGLARRSEGARFTKSGQFWEEKRKVHNSKTASLMPLRQRKKAEGYAHRITPHGLLQAWGGGNNCYCHFTHDSPPKNPRKSQKSG